MAEIKMDVSEYEALKKNIQLLEESKKREEQLNDQVKKLQEEKIQALEDAGKSVSKITKTIERKTVFTKKEPKEILDSLQMVLRNRNSGHYSDSDRALIEKMKEHFFGIKQEETVKDVSIITKGFEEVRAEMETQYFRELSQDTQKELRRIDSLAKENDDLSKSNFELKNKNLELKDYKEKYEKADKDREENFKLYLKADHRVDLVKSILKLNWNMFNFNTIKNRIEVAVKTEKK